MTAREELLQRAMRWTDREATIALKAVEREQHSQEDVAEEWGDVSALRAALEDYDDADTSGPPSP